MANHQESRQPFKKRILPFIQRMVSFNLSDMKTPAEIAEAKKEKKK